MNRRHAFAWTPVVLTDGTLAWFTPYLEIQGKRGTLGVRCSCELRRTLVYWFAWLSGALKTPGYALPL